MEHTLPGIVIPAFQPQERLVGLVDELLQTPAAFIVIVNDGSDPDHDPIFEELAQRERVEVLRHAVNLGKGQALKTAFNHVLLRHPECPGVVTVDADGQHLPSDVDQLLRRFAKAPLVFLLGVRQFTGRVPLRSRFGNTVTRQVFRFFVGRRVVDTQSGLRAIPRALLLSLLRIKATGYDFELEMLITVCESGLPMEEVPIETVYEEHNPTSHFNPLLDSLRIYFVFLRFISLSLSCFVLDTLIYSLVYYLTGGILGSLIAGRAVSGTYQFLGSKLLVFRSSGRLASEALKYLALLLLLMLGNYLAITVMVDYLGMNPYLSKVLSEAFFFLTSFTVQKTLVFIKTPQL